jgi:signal transduction histidine kinase
MLTAIGLDLAALAEQAARGEGARQSAPDFLRQVEETHQLVRMLRQELRMTSYLLHPPLLDEVGLSSALRWYAKGVAQRSGIAIDFQIANDFGRLSRALELTLFRVVQESLTNIHRHSGSKRATVRMSRDAGIIALQVEDSGKGIPPEQLAVVQSGASGFGIRAMRERLRPFGGQLEITSNDGGTQVQVRIPQASLPEWSRSNRCWP